MTSQPIVAVLVNLPVAERLTASSTTLACFAVCYAYFYWSFRLPWGVSLSSACSFLVIFADCKNILRYSGYEKGASALKCCDGVRSGACFGFWPKSAWAADSSCVTSEFLAFDCELAMPTDTYSEYILITVLSHTLCCCNLVFLNEQNLQLHAGGQGEGRFVMWPSVVGRSAGHLFLSFTILFAKTKVTLSLHHYLLGSLKSDLGTPICCGVLMCLSANQVHLFLST